jgi:hypothetical protein
MNFENREQMIEQKLRFAKIMGVIFDALFICDIEHDKISLQLRPRLTLLVGQLAEKYPPKINPAIPSAEIKLSITRESLKTLHQTIMETITRRFNEIGMKGFKKDDLFKELETIIKEAIKYEKGHREAEKT